MSLGARPIPSARRTVATARNRGGVADAAGQFGAAVSQFAGQALEKQDKVNYATAKGKLLQELTAAQSELENDPDYGTLTTRFDAKAAKVREEASKLIKSRSDRAMFDADAGNLIFSAQADVKKLAWGKEVLTLKAGADTFAEEQMDLAANASTVEARAATLGNYGTYIDGLVQKGVFDPVEGAKRKRAFNGDSTYQRVQSLQSQDRLDEAWDTFQTNRNFLTADQEIALERGLRSGLDRRQSYQDADTALVAPEKPLVIPGELATGGRAAFMQRVRGVESSGNDRAKNQLSSASGRYQFTKDTWENLGGDWANRFDAGAQERFMAKLTDQNEAALKRGGIDLTPGNYYLAHFAGAGGARALHSNPNAPVEAVLGNDVVKANPFLKGMKSRDVINWAAKKMGGKGDQPISTSEVPDLGVAYDNIDARAELEQWSPERRERAKEQVSVRINRMKAVENERQSESYDVAMEKVAGMGDNFTDVSQLGDLDVSGTQLNTLTNIAAANARALRAEGNAAAKAQMAETNDLTALKLDLWEQDNPKGFATSDISELLPKLSPANRAKYIKRQAAVAETLKNWNPYSQINGALTRAAQMGGVTLKDKDKVAVREIMLGEAQRLHAANGGKPISYTEYDQLFLNATREVKTNGGLLSSGGSVPRYAVQPGDKARSDITASFKRINGREPTEDELLSIYRRTFVQK